MCEMLLNIERCVHNMHYYVVNVLRTVKCNMQGISNLAVSLSSVQNEFYSVQYPMSSVHCIVQCPVCVEH